MEDSGVQMILITPNEHVCTNPTHGIMMRRPIGRGTPEQDWCGTWFDCPHCHESVLIKSPALMMQLAE
jgi:hypothetical protein